MCQWSGEDLYTEFNVLNVRIYLQLVCGSALLMWYVITYCCKSVFCSFILLTKDTLKIIICWLRLMDSPSRRYCLEANKGTSYFYVTRSKHIHRRLEFLKDTWPEGNLISIKTMRLADGGRGGGRVVWPPRTLESKGQQNIYLNKNFDFLHSTNFKLSRKTRGNSLYNCDILRSEFLSGLAIVITHPERQKTLATSLIRTYSLVI